MANDSGYLQGLRALHLLASYRSNTSAGATYYSLKLLNFPGSPCTCNAWMSFVYLKVLIAVFIIVSILILNYQPVI